MNRKSRLKCYLKRFSGCCHSGVGGGGAGVQAQPQNF